MTRPEALGRSAAEGAGYGALAGILFAIMEMVGAAAMGQPAVMPLRMFASVVMGQPALMATPAGTTLVAGIVTHLVASAAFGLIYGLLVGTRPRETRASWGKQAAGGIVYGLLLWLVNFHVIARIAYPWFLDTPQFLQATMHALFYGLPLGLMYAAGERRVWAARPAPRPA